MSELERALAERRTDEAMAMAQATLRIVRRMRALLVGVARQHAKNSVLHLD